MKTADSLSLGLPSPWIRAPLKNRGWSGRAKMLGKLSVPGRGWSGGAMVLGKLSVPGRGWSGGAMVLGKLPVPVRPTYLYYSRARAYCACGGCGRGLFGYFFSQLSFIFSFSLILGDGLI